MLAHILPGLRELRAPLSAGYLWITFIWLIAAPYVPEASEARGLARRVLDMIEGLDAVGTGVILSFVAYLIGAVSQSVIDPLLRRIPMNFGGVQVGEARSLSAKGFRSLTQLVEERLDSVRLNLQGQGLTLVEVATRERRKDTLARAGLTDDELKRAEETRSNMENLGVDFMLLGTFLEAVEAIDPQSGLVALATYGKMLAAGIPIDDVLPLGRPEPDGALPERSRVARSLVVQSGIDLGVALDVVRVIREAKEMGFTDQQLRWAGNTAHLLPGSGVQLEDVRLARDVVRRMEAASRRTAEWDVANLLERVIEELDLVTTRLIGVESELYSAIDRLRAESEFRLAIAPPLTALCILFGIQLHPLWLLGLGLAGILLADGKSRDQAARDLVVDALLLRRVEAPALQKFERSANEVVSARAGSSAALKHRPDEAPREST